MDPQGTDSFDSESNESNENELTSEATNEVSETETATSEATSEATPDESLQDVDSAERESGALGLDDEAELSNPKTEELSSEFVGRWSTLISTTNWEKGKIISEWREALMGSESPSSTYSDEAWAQQVGGVTAQHVGRLRRVHDRFGSSYTTYQGLYWSHFLAAIDWDDAEMYLEGATQSSWSVSQMRRTRWEAMGGEPGEEPQEAEIAAVTQDEDFTPLAEVDETGVRDDSRGVAEGPRAEDPDFGDEDSYASGEAGTMVEEDEALPWEDADGAGGAPADSPFADLPSLPTDLAEALEQFKLGIIRHRADSWAEVAQEDVIKSVEALRIFAAQ
ncbi:MAG: hypothetical protein AAF483_18830 [Planctomycetota bacterium]